MSSARPEKSPSAPLRVGILCSDFAALADWELRLFHELRHNPNYRLVAVVTDGRPKMARDRWMRLLRSGNIAGKVLFKLQSKLESALFKPAPFKERDATFNFLRTLERIELLPRRKGLLDLFSDSDARLVERYELDVLLRHEFNIIRGPILSAARHGIWSVHHGDNDVNRGGPVGFWEIVFRQSVVGVTLQRLTAELDGGKIIGKGYYNRDWSCVRSEQFVVEKSVQLILSNLDRLQRGEDIAYQESRVYSYPLLKVPDLKWLALYCAQFYWTLATKAGNALAKALGRRPYCWTLFTSSGNILGSTLHRATLIQPPAGEFWADPFVAAHRGTSFVFFENYSYANTQGKISCGELEHGKIVRVRDVLVRPYHLSYPFLWAHGGEWFMIPETSCARRLEVYKAVGFPDRWELFATAFEGESLADSTVYQADDGALWLFTSKSTGPQEDHSSELFIYRIDSPLLREIVPHRRNPVIVDSRRARNAGPIFRKGGDVIRPSQNNSHGVYGYGFNLSLITKLTLDEYEEEIISTVVPSFRPGLIATHHVCQAGDFFVLDGCFARL